MQRWTLLPKESDPSQFTSSRRWTSPFSAAPNSNSTSVTSPGSPSSYSYSQGNTSEERQTLINTCYGSRTSNSSLENTRTTLPPPRIESSPNPTSLVCSSLRRKTYSRGGPSGTEKTATPRVIHWRQCVTNWHTFEATAPPATPPSPACGIPRNGTRSRVAKSRQQYAPSSAPHCFAIYTQKPKFSLRDWSSICSNTEIIRSSRPRTLVISAKRHSRDLTRPTRRGFREAGTGSV